MDLIIFSASFAALSFLAFTFFRFMSPRLALGAGVLFAIYLGLDDLATVIPRLFPALDFVSASQWNWSGKLWSIALALVAMLAFGLSRRDVGLVAPKNVKLAVIVTAALITFSFSLGFVFDPDIPNAETVAFQLLMPGFSEELAYRGLAPAILLGLYRPGSKLPDPGSHRIPWNVILITAIMFGAWHGLGYADGAYSFSLLPALFPFIGAVAYGWLRFYSGSLLFPVLAHGLGNAAFMIPSIL